MNQPPISVRNLLALSHAVTEKRKNWLLDEVNENCLRMAVMTGEFPWHYHPGSAELFIVLEGQLHIDLADGTTVTLRPMDIYTVPAEMVHRTRAEVRTVNLCFEHSQADTVFVDNAGLALQHARAGAQD